MAVITAESQSQYRAFRRFIYSLSRQLSQDEAQAIVYIHFFDQKSSLKSASTLDILCKLESSGIATFNNPEKLLELMKDLKRNDLVSEVKEFLKRRTKTADRRGLSLGRRQPRLVLAEDVEETESEDDLILRNTLEAAIVQATVLLQHMEKIQSSISGRKLKRGELRQTVTEAAQTSEVLAERLRGAEVRINHDEGEQRLSSASESEAQSGEFGSGSYINTAHTDRYSKIISSSLPGTGLSDYYTPIPREAKLDNLQEESTEKTEDDDDDYERMNPANLAEIVHTNPANPAEIVHTNPEKWKEVKKTILGPGNDYSIPRPHTTTTPDLTSVQYSSLALTGHPEGNTTTEAPAVNKRNSTPLSCRPFAYTKPDTDSHSSNPLSPISESPRHWQRSAHISVKGRGGRLTKSVLVESPTQAPPTADDNYTTLHPTAKQQLQEDPHYYKPLDRSCVAAPDEYTAVQHQDYRSN